MAVFRCAGAIALVMLLTGCFGSKSAMTQYMPIERTVIRNQIKLTPRPDWKTAEHMACIQEIFRTNHIKFKIKDGNILIDEELAADWATIADFSMKANDPDWNKKKNSLQQNRTTVQPPPRLNSGWSIQSGGR